MVVDYQPLTEESRKEIEACVRIPNSGEHVTEEEASANFDWSLKVFQPVINEALDNLSRGKVDCD